MSHCTTWRRIVATNIAGWRIAAPTSPDNAGRTTGNNGEQRSARRKVGDGEAQARGGGGEEEGFDAFAVPLPAVGSQASRSLDRVLVRDASVRQHHGQAAGRDVRG